MYRNTHHIEKIKNNAQPKVNIKKKASKKGDKTKDRTITRWKKLNLL